MKRCCADDCFLVQCVSLIRTGDSMSCEVAKDVSRDFVVNRRTRGRVVDLEEGIEGSQPEIQVVGWSGKIV